jgi:hypothetical protein
MELFATAQKALNRTIRTRPWMLLAIPAAAGGGMFAVHPYLADPLQGWLGTAGAQDLGEGVGAFLTVVGVIYALIIGFTFQQAFGRQAELRQKLTAEASSLRNLILLSGTMRVGTAHQSVAGHLLRYVERLLDHEFPPEDSVDAAPILYQIVPVLNEISADGVADAVDRITLNAIHDELRTTTRARSERLSIAARHIPRIHWFQIELLSSLIMMGFLLLDLRAPLLEALLLGLTTGAIMVLYLSLFDLDYPFGGLWRVEPLGLERLRRELHGKPGKPGEAGRAASRRRA